MFDRLILVLVLVVQFVRRKGARDREGRAGPLSGACFWQPLLSVNLLCIPILLCERNAPPPISVTIKSIIKQPAACWEPERGSLCT
jgi:hypothetical protein